MFAIQRRYLDLVRERGFRLPGALSRLHADDVERIRTALAARSTRGTVPCNNDLLAANIIDDGARLWFIDYEYAGNNDACFELGNIWSEANLDPDAARASWSRPTTAGPSPTQGRPGPAVRA